MERQGERTAAAQFLDKLTPLFAQQELVKKVVAGTQIEEIILDEARKDYDLLVFGASEEARGRDIVFTPLVDYLVRLSPCPTMVVQGQRIQPDWMPRRILVPTNGSRAARNAAELSFALASEPEDEVVILHVVVEEPDPYHLDAGGEAFERRLDIGHDIVDELRELAETLKVRATTSVQVGTDPESLILEVAREHHLDLIVLGTDVRPGSGRLFLGPRVERILKNAACPVVVFNS